MFFPGASVGLNLFQAAQLASAWPIWSQVLFFADLPPLRVLAVSLVSEREYSALIAYYVGKGLGEANQFGGLPDATFSCLLSCLKSIPS